MSSQTWLKFIAPSKKDVTILQFRTIGVYNSVNIATLHMLGICGWPCWSSKGNQTSTSYVSFSLLFLLPHLDGFYFTHFDIWLIYCIDFPSPSGVYLSTFDLSSGPFSHFPRVNPSAEIDIPNSSAKSDRATKSSALLSACVQGYRVLTSLR